MTAAIKDVLISWKMFRNSITELLQSKNVIMFLTAIFFMAGILAFFNNCIVILAILVTFLLVVSLLGRFISYKYVLLWGFVFYFGFFYTAGRIKNSDDLFHYAPADAVLTGRIVSVPNSNTKDKMKFFFEVSGINGNEVKGKTLVQLQDENGDFSNLNIGNVYQIEGKLRVPFKASNPSQFDYGKYLRNFDVFRVIYYLIYTLVVTGVWLQGAIDWIIVIMGLYFLCFRILCLLAITQETFSGYIQDLRYKNNPHKK